MIIFIVEFTSTSHMYFPSVAFSSFPTFYLYNFLFCSPYYSNPARMFSEGTTWCVCISNLFISTLQPREKGRMRFHKLQNVQIALDFLRHRQVWDSSCLEPKTTTTTTSWKALSKSSARTNWRRCVFVVLRRLRRSSWWTSGTMTLQMGTPSWRWAWSGPSSSTSRSPALSVLRSITVVAAILSLSLWDLQSGSCHLWSYHSRPITGDSCSVPLKSITWILNQTSMKTYPVGGGWCYRDFFTTHPQSNISLISKGWVSENGAHSLFNTVSHVQAECPG